MRLRTLVHLVGLIGTGTSAAGLAGISMAWRWTNYLAVRLAVIVVAAAAFVALMYLSFVTLIIMSYVYLFVIGVLLFVHLVLLAALVIRWLSPSEDDRRAADVHPLLRRALAAERSLDYSEAIKAYEEYLGKFVDAQARSRLAEILIKAGNSRRAVSVLTVAFSEAEEPKQKIALGVRLAEVLLAAERDPVAARTQLEQLRTIFKETEHEAYVEDLAGRMMKRVAEGRYLKKKPERPKYGPG